MADYSFNVIRSYNTPTNPAPGIYDVFLRLVNVGYPSVSLVRNRVNGNYTFNAYSRWRDGPSGAPTYTNLSGEVFADSLTGEARGLGIRLRVSAAQIKILNDADRFEVSFAGDNYVCTVTHPNYLVMTRPNVWQNRTFGQFVAGAVASVSVTELDARRVRVAVSHTFDVSSASFYITGIDNLANTRASDFPIDLTAGSFTAEYNGSYGTQLGLRVNFGIGGGAPGNVYYRDTNLVRLPDAPPPPTVPDFGGTRVEIVSVVSTAEGEITVEWEVTPALAQSAPGRFDLKLREVFPRMRSVGTSSTTDARRRSIGRGGIERGKSYSVTVEYRKSSTEVFVSDAVFFRYGQRLELQADIQHILDSLREARVFVRRIDRSNATLDIVSDTFLTNFVTGLSVNLATLPDSSNVSEDNTMSSATIEITTPQFNSTVAVAVVVTIHTIFGDVDLDEIPLNVPSVVSTTSPIVTESDVAMSKVISMAYDQDTAEIIDALPQPCRVRMVEEALVRAEMPQNDGRMHNFNKANRKGSIFTQQNSDRTKTQYQRVIDENLGDVAALVPDIDAGLA